MNEALHKLHSVDVDEADLGDFGKRGKIFGNGELYDKTGNEHP